MPWLFQRLASEYSYSNIHGIEMKKPIGYAKKHNASKLAWDRSSALRRQLRIDRRLDAKCELG